MGISETGVCDGVECAADIGCGSGCHVAGNCSGSGMDIGGLTAERFGNTAKIWRRRVQRCRRKSEHRLFVWIAGADCRLDWGGWLDLGIVGNDVDAHTHCRDNIGINGSCIRCEASLCIGAP